MMRQMPQCYTPLFSGVVKTDPTAVKRLQSFNYVFELVEIIEDGNSHLSIRWAR